MALMQGPSQSSRCRFKLTMCPEAHLLLGMEEYPATLQGMPPWHLSGDCLPRRAGSPHRALMGALYLVKCSNGTTQHRANRVGIHSNRPCVPKDTHCQSLHDAKAGQAVLDGFPLW
ncbi:hypothetical protein FN846DRAFT_886021 [Sphaerosporella brunnea]|uniref:Uncharacterized protein n=1 Tax=Sphaerosporella brunnea TaxID=1250544 RepID=A0A5J5FA20_9PEZI|nr:hypothetical protein FN846DRAFT_886021 [Sphaerosporella brunnea]